MPADCDSQMRKGQKCRAKEAVLISLAMHFADHFSQPSSKGLRYSKISVADLPAPGDSYVVHSKKTLMAYRP